jgi:thiosulfate/3-mercaptopyruvate sulfurtransferase
MVSPLISAHELRSRLEDSDIVILDCRWYINDAAQGRNVYDEAHIPGARFVRLDTDLSRGNGPGRHPLPTHEAFGETCERLGIDRSSHVVLYDDLGGAIGARTWWMLTNQGHLDVSVLDGGLDAWIAIDGQMTDEVPTVETTTFPTRPWVGTVDRYQVEHRPDTTILIDARAPERYRGDYEPIDPVAGHIPGALSVPQSGNLNPDMTFRPPGELRERYLSAGIGNAEDVIALCGSGVTACHNILAMVIAGMPGTHLYVGSWSDWSSAGMPTVVGNDPR